MHKIVHTLIGLMLVVTIAMTSASMALARGQMRDATGTIILCTGSGPVALQVDKDGQPIGPLPICPDCVFNFLDLADAVPFIPAQYPRGLASYFDFQNDQMRPDFAHAVRARGPPAA